MSKSAEFLFDVMSPYSYLASTQLAAIEQRTGATIRWVPVYLPGVFKTTGNKGPMETPLKAMYALKDCNDWAKHYGLGEIILPDTFPFSSAAALRACLAADEVGKGAAVATALFDVIWREHRAANDEGIIGDALRTAGLDAAKILERSKADDLREKLKADTQAAVDRGTYGVPTFFVGDEMFVGNDRLMFVEKALRS